MAIKATYTHPAAPNNAERSTEWYFPHEIKTAMAIPALSRSVATDFNLRHQKGYSGMGAVLWRIHGVSVIGCARDNALAVA